MKAPLVTSETQTTFGGLVPDMEIWPVLTNVIHFILFKKPFEEVINSMNLIEMDGKKRVVRNDGYRIYSISQDELLDDGWEYPEDYDIKKLGKFKQGQYGGNKLGNKYLRAPDIFFTILQKSAGKLMNINKMGDVRYPIKTGINDFFYINKETIRK